MNEEESKFAKWTTAYMNDLPDSSFAYIAPGGKKDKEGKTVPRTLRHLPYKDASGKIDLAHLRNALSRVMQTDLPREVQLRIQKRLQGIAAKNLKTSKQSEGKTMISKFEKTDENIGKIKEIIDTLKGLTDGKQDADVVEMYSKDVNALVSDLNALVSEVEETEENKEEGKEESKEEDKKEDEEKKEEGAEDKKEEGSEEKKDEKAEGEEKKDEGKEESKDEDKKEDADADEKKDEGEEKKDEGSEEKKEESKFKALCEEYSHKLKEANVLISTKDEIITKLSQEKAAYVEEISKFKEAEELKKKAQHDKSLDKAAKAYSKFKGLSEDAAEVLDKKKEWMTSKMSDVALEEIGNAYEMQSVSKMSSTTKAETKPSSQLESKAPEQTSKMSNEEKLAAIANRAAKKQGWKGDLIE